MCESVRYILGLQVVRRHKVSEILKNAYLFVGNRLYDTPLAVEGFAGAHQRLNHMYWTGPAATNRIYFTETCIQKNRFNIGFANNVCYFVYCRGAPHRILAGRCIRLCSVF
jgi:hypothetical protein